MDIDLDYFQKALEEEKMRLEAGLGTVGVRNPDAPEDWEAAKPDLNITVAEKSEVADQEEEFENQAGVEANLEERLREVDAALERVRHGSYGKCAFDNEEIDEARLRANPAAKTCIEHAQ